MPFPIDVNRCLAFARTDTPIRVSTIPFDTVRAKLAARGLCEGDEIVVELATDGHVIVAKREGRRVLVERQDAVMIEVEPRAPLSITPPPSMQRSTASRMLAAAGA